MSSLRSEPRPWWAAVALLGALWAAGASAATLRTAIGDGMVATLTDEGAIYLETPPLQGEGLLAFTRRLTGDDKLALRISEENSAPRRLLAGVRYRVPFALLLGEYKLRVVRGLFPNDEPRAAGWYHVVPPGARGQSLWQIAEQFTGDGRNFKTLREANLLADDTMAPGQGLLIPGGLLLPVFAAALPVETGSQLAYQSDASGEYAVYRLKAGEALYSSVVVRFTGRTYAEDVNALAAEIAKLNAIPDVTDIATGHPIRIPYDVLLPEYLPAGHPRRVEYEQALSESALYSNPIRSAHLDGITVILDAGHGGADPGAMKGEVWESVYVYDVMLRVKHLLETTTSAQVVPTTRDGGDWRIVDRDKLPISRGHAVLTKPPYPITEAATGVHFRWYLANSAFATAVESHGDAEKVVFLSFHAESLHPTIRGAMVYVPAAALRKGEYGKSAAIYQAREEVRQRPTVSFAWKERVMSEGLSRELAERLVRAFRKNGLGVHPEKPVRDKIIRSRRSHPYVPAVIRYNAVPAKVLLEICNLNNEADRRQLQTREFRQKVAEAVVAALLDYYGEQTALGSSETARVSR